MSPFAAALRDWLVAEQGLAPAGLGPDTPLFSSRLLDSLALVDLLAWVEAFSGVRIGWMDVSLENLDSIARIEALVAARR